MGDSGPGSRVAAMSVVRSAVLAAEGPASEGGITGMVIGLMERLGGPGAGLAVAIENLFPPIPSEVILPLAGFTASQGDMSLASAIIWTTIGSVVGAVALYYIGAALGRDRVIAIAAKLPLVNVADIDRTEAWFLKHGTKAVFFGRFIPVFRSLISIPAGLERMKMTTFLLCTAAGSLIWNTIFIMLGYVLGEQWSEIEGYVGTYQYIVIGICAVAAAVWIGLRIRRRLQADKVERAEYADGDPATRTSDSSSSSAAGSGFGSFFGDDDRDGDRGAERGFGDDSGRGQGDDRGAGRTYGHGGGDNRAGQTYGRGAGDDSHAGPAYGSGDGDLNRNPWESAPRPEPDTGQGRPAGTVYGTPRRPADD